MKNVKLIAQAVDIFPGDGKHPYARTGKLDFHHIKRAGATGIILGHSEVNESPETVNKKLIAAFNEVLKDNVVLLGESWEEIGKSWSECSDGEKEKVKKVVQEKLFKILNNVDKEIAQVAIFGYEPGWGVRGSGKEDVPPPGFKQIKALSGALRDILAGLYTEEAARRIRIIYGGSSSPERVEEIMPIEDIDGFILGSSGTATDWVKKIGDSIITISKSKQSGRKPVLVLNWKAYLLQESYDDFLKVISTFDGKLDIYLAPSATDLRELREKIE